MCGLYDETLGIHRLVVVESLCKLSGYTLLKIGIASVFALCILFSVN